MAAAFRKLLSSEPLCVGTRNEDQEIVRSSTGMQMDKALSGSGWSTSRRTCRSNGIRLRVSALLKAITSLLDLEVAESEYIMRSPGLDEAQAGIKIARRNINNLRYADDTTLMAESKEELKSFLMKAKEESEKSWLKTQHSEN